MEPSRFLPPSQPPLPLQFANKIDNSPIDPGHIHRLHRLQIHSRDEISIIIINMHGARRMIANPPNENVTATSDTAHSSKIARIENCSNRELIVDPKVRD